MNQVQTTLLELLRLAIRQQKYTGDPEQDWDAVFHEANIQTVTALAAKALPPALDKKSGEKWRNAEYRQLADYLRYLFAQDELCRLFREKEIPLAILKGTAAAVYYPQPSLRTMGDIDFIVPEAHFQRAKAIMLEAGYEMKHESKRHGEFLKDGTEFELHRKFSRGPVEEDDAYIREGMKNLVTGTVDGHVFPMLPRLANGMVLLDHMRAHLVSGMGLRQMIDWMMFVERELDDAFWADGFHAAAKDKDLDVLAITSARACQKYFGLSKEITWCGGADDRLCDELMENLLSNGNFGYQIGGGKVEMVTNSIRNIGFIGNLQRAGLSNWKAVDKHPWLRPFAWIYQLFRYLGQMLRMKDRKKIMTDIKRSRDRYDLLKKLKVY